MFVYLGPEDLAVEKTNAKKIAAEARKENVLIEKILKGKNLTDEQKTLYWKIHDQNKKLINRIQFSPANEEGILRLINEMLNGTFVRIILYRIFKHPTMKKEILLSNSRQFKCRKKRKESCEANCSFAAGCIDRFVIRFQSPRYSKKNLKGIDFEKECKEHLAWVQSQDDESPLSFKNCLESRGNVDTSKARAFLDNLKTKSLKELIEIYQRYKGSDEEAENKEKKDLYTDDVIEFEQHCKETIAYEMPAIRYP